MAEAISSIRDAKDQLRSDAENLPQIEANTYPAGVVAAACKEAHEASDPGLFDRTFYVQSVATGSSDMDSFGGPFSDVFDRSEAEMENSDLSPLKSVFDDVTSSDYTFQGRTRSRLRSGPYPIKKDRDEALIAR